MEETALTADDFAPPMLDLGSAACHETGPWRDGLLLVLSPTTILPDRCIRCNADAMRLRGSRKISTLSAWYPLFASAGWDAESVQNRPVRITYGLCARHRLARAARVLLIAILGSACIFPFANLVRTKTPSLLAEILAVLAPMIFLTSTLLLRPLIRPRRVYEGLAWFAGAGPGFLDSLPELSARPAPPPEGLSN